MPKTDLTECSNVLTGIIVRLIDYNESDDLNPLVDFTGIDEMGVVPLTEVCKTGIISSTYSTYPVVATFDYPVCQNNCEMYTSGWSKNAPNNYGLQVTSSYEIGGTAVGVYVINKQIKDFVEDTWARLQDTAGSQVTRVMWCLPIAIVLGVVACFTMESSGDDGEQGQEMNS